MLKTHRRECRRGHVIQAAVWAAANICFNQGSDKAKEFASEILHIAKREGPTVLLSKLIDERNKYRSKAKRKSLKELVRYVARRFEMYDYPKFIEQGWQIGSGPTEAMCKVLTYRLKGAGMRWDRPGADAIMALIALEQSNTWKSYWDVRKRAASPCQNIWSHPRKANYEGLVAIINYFCIMMAKQCW